jgi:hypothetical protein
MDGDPRSIAINLRALSESSPLRMIAVWGASSWFVSDVIDRLMNP